ncbi:hypothetical protein KP509_1Z028300 [Ceratopteris richardii]|nr:hypothetical protein KP509_1Z028300 [Ceratopteris richardii]KAH6559097.1 hypothetical protein KP509_1Z028300 [Ceratopteris richardii]KAH6559098.1 hypothetical protein KP509_1Z028300 [Ceratopteris richardii]
MLMKRLKARSMSRLDKSISDSGSDELGERYSADGTSSSGSFDRFCADVLGDSFSTGSPRDPFWDLDDSTSTSVESSPIGWTRPPRDRSRLGKLHSLPRLICTSKTTKWEEAECLSTLDFNSDVSEVDVMKERFAKLLLGEDLSGGGKGVCSALAISNAITNLSASVFGGLNYVGPLSHDRKETWQREMGWLLSVSEHIVEFVPSSQVLPNGNVTEVMITKPRSDLHINLPALRKLDNMLIEILDSFSDVELWYFDHKNVSGFDDDPQPHSREKWWLRAPKVPLGGLPIAARKQLQIQRENTNQVLKAASAINAQVLTEMEVPSAYWDALPKNGRSSLGEALYRTITSERFSPDALIASIDDSHERNVLEMVNRVEAATQTWRRKLQTRQGQMIGKDGRNSSKPSWGISKDGTSDLEKREVLIDKAETLLLLLKNKFPGLPQTILDVYKIQYNKDVGQSIIESYSRVLENLAFNILMSIDDILHVDDLARVQQPQLTRNESANQNSIGSLHDIRGRVCLSKSASISGPGTLWPLKAAHSKKLSEHFGRTAEDIKPQAEHFTACPPSLRSIYSKKVSEQNWSPVAAVGENKSGYEYHAELLLRRGPLKNWSFSGSVNGTRSPPSRD